MFARQHKWKWVKDKDAYDGRTGREEWNDKEPKDFQDFFNVMKEVSVKEYSDLWGLNLERL